MPRGLPQREPGHMPHRSVAVRPLERPWLVMRQSAFIAPTDCDAEDRVLKLVAEANNALSTHDPARGNCSPQRNMVAGAPGAPQKDELQKRTPDGHRWPSTGSTRLARVVKAAMALFAATPGVWDGHRWPRPHPRATKKSRNKTSINAAKSPPRELGRWPCAHRGGNCGPAMRLAAVERQWRDLPARGRGPCLTRRTLQDGWSWHRPSPAIAPVALPAGFRRQPEDRSIAIQRRAQ